MEYSEKPIYRFADIEVDTLRGYLRRGDKERHLRQKAFHVLVYLLEQRGRLVTKDELMREVWNDVAVTDDALVQCVKEIRRVTGDDSHHPRFIKTVPKSGYRFIGQIDEQSDAPIVGIEEITSIEIEYEEESCDTETRRGENAETSLLRGKFISASPRRLLIAALGLILTAAIALPVYFSRSEKSNDGFTLPVEPGKRRLAVMFFENQSGSAEFEWLREGLADMLINNLSRSEKLNVLSRQQLRILLERGGYKTGDKINLETALETARKSRVEFIVVGSFARIGEKVRLDAQVYNVETGRLETAESLTVEKIEQILTEIDLLCLKLAKYFGAGESQNRMPLTDVMTDNLEAYRCYSLAVEKAQAYHNQEAITLLERAVALDAQFAMAHARLGYIYAVTWGLAEKAKPHLEKAFRLSDRLTKIDRLYITAWYQIANFDYAKAIPPFREIISMYPTETEAYQRLGHLLRGEGQYDEAIETWKQGLAVDPEAQDIYNALGGIYSNLNRHNEAVSMMRRYVELAPDEPNAHDSLALIYQWAGRHDEALEEYNRALNLNPAFEISVVNRGNLFFQMGRYDEAERQYERYLQMARSDLEREKGWGSLAYLYLKKGELEKAKEAADKELQYGKQSSFGNSLMIALKKGDLARAEKLKEKIFTQSPYTHRGARAPMRQLYYLLGSLELKKRNAAAVVNNFQTALQQLAPLGGMELMEDCLANAYLELGRFEEAAAEYERILRLNPNYPLARYHLAEAYKHKGLYAEARANYQLFLEIWKNADADIPEIVEAKKFVSETY